LRRTAGALAVAALLPAGAAIAAPMTITLDFALSGFADALGNLPPPSAFAAGNITLTYDPMVGTGPTSVGLQVNSLSGLSSASQLQFSAGTGGSVSFGGSANGPGIVAAGVEDFVVQFDLSNLAAPRLFTCADPGFSCGSFTGNAGFTSSAYTVAGVSAGWFAATGSVRIVPNPMPEPGTLVLVALALAAAAALRKPRLKPVV
jgi:hypothetical protein